MDVAVAAALAGVPFPQAHSNRARPPKRILVSDDVRNFCSPTYERSSFTLLGKVEMCGLFEALLSN